MISVIMSTYNGSNTIDKSIQSILNQTYNNFEFIICNDGSTDNTLDHIKSFARYDNRIKIINNHNNLGLQKSLNKCIEKSIGNFIARMDDDDISLNTRFTTQMNFLNQHPNVAFIGSNIKFFSDKRGIYGQKKFPNVPSSNRLFESNCFSHPSVIIRSNILKKVGGYSNKKSFHRVEDYELWIRLYSKGYYGVNLQKYLLYYKKDINSIYNIKFNDRINCFKLLKKYRKKLNINYIKYIYILLPLIKLLLPVKIRAIINYLLYSK